MGVDCSTQSFKVTLINTQLQIVFQETLHFDTHLPHYNTHHGVITSEHKINEAKRSDSNAATPSVDDDGNGRDDLEAGAPSAMFVEAMDVVLSKLQSCVDVDVGRIVAISGSGQQHGSVYWRKGASKVSVI